MNHIIFQICLRQLNKTLDLSKIKNYMKFIILQNSTTYHSQVSIKSNSGSWERLPLFSLNSSTKYFISRMSCQYIFSHLLLLLFCICEKGVKYLWLVIKPVTRFRKLWKWSLKKMCDHDSWQFNILFSFQISD